MLLIRASDAFRSVISASTNSLWIELLWAKVYEFNHFLSDRGSERSQSIDGKRLLRAIESEWCSHLSHWQSNLYTSLNFARRCNEGRVQSAYACVNSSPAWIGRIAIICLVYCYQDSSKIMWREWKLSWDWMNLDWRTVGREAKSQDTIRRARVI